MPKTAKERVYLSRERKKLGLVHIDDWTELEFANVYKELKAIYAGKKFWKDIVEVIKNYKD